MEFYQGFDIESRTQDMEFAFAVMMCLGAAEEKNILEAIRSLLRDAFLQGLKYFTVLLWM